MARPKLPLSLSPEQKSELQRLVKAPAAAQKVVRWARIALLAAQGQDNKQIASTLETSLATVGLCAGSTSTLVRHIKRSRRRGWR